MENNIWYVDAFIRITKQPQQLLIMSQVKGTPTATLTTPDHLLPLTPEEQSLLDLYGKVKQFERDAAVAKAEAAKAKLTAANEEYHRELEKEHGISENPSGSEVKPLKQKNRKKRRGHEMSSEGDQRENIPSSDEGSSDEKELTDTYLSRLREERDLAARRQEQEQASDKLEEEKRKRFLEGDKDTVDVVSDFGLSLRKGPSRQDGKETSLISKMNPVSTPPRDFSKSLAMSKVSGTQLFPDSRTASPTDFWTPPEGAMEIKLNDFDGSKAAVGSGNNTVAIKFSSPTDSKRFSINIAEENHENYYSVLFHFNPRQFERGGQVVVNDKKAGMWGSSINVPLSNLPLMFGEVASTLIVQINGDGFDVFMNGQHCARLEHRTALPEKACSLILQLPSTDDYGNSENWTVYKVWWGHKPSMEGKDLANVPGVNSHNSVHEKKLFVSGLPKISLQPQIDLRRAELERAFRKYGGQQGVTVICPPNCTFAFVEVETERSADLALREMGSKYRLNRARRSRHEALLAQRAATEAGVTTETLDWD